MVTSNAILDTKPCSDRQFQSLFSGMQGSKLISELLKKWPRNAYYTISSHKMQFDFFLNSDFAWLWLGTWSYKAWNGQRMSQGHDPRRFSSSLSRLKHLFCTERPTMPYHKNCIFTRAVYLMNSKLSFAGLPECSCKALSNDNFELKICPKVTPIVVEGGPSKQIGEAGHNQWGAG